MPGRCDDQGKDSRMLPRHNPRSPAALVLGVMALAVASAPRAGRADEQEGGAGARRPPVLTVRDPGPKAADHPIAPRSAAGQAADESPAGGSGAWWLGSVGIGLALAAFVVLAMAGRKGLPGRELGPLEVVGRVGLSPRHSVYLLRAGGRVLLVGAGSQGPPALLGELEVTDPSERARLGLSPAPGPRPASGGGES
jgi:hypothetical protein